MGLLGVERVVKAGQLNLLVTTEEDWHRDGQEQENQHNQRIYEAELEKLERRKGDEARGGVRERYFG
jgi:hypothetical protein